MGVCCSSLLTRRWPSKLSLRAMWRKHRGVSTPALSVFLSHHAIEKKKLACVSISRRSFIIRYMKFSRWSWPRQPPTRDTIRAIACLILTYSVFRGSWNMWVFLIAKLTAVASLPSNRDRLCRPWYYVLRLVIIWVEFTLRIQQRG